MHRVCTPPFDDPDALLTPRQAADALTMSVRTIQRYAQDGTIAVLRIGKVIRIPAAELTKLIRHSPAK